MKILPKLNNQCTKTRNIIIQKYYKMAIQHFQFNFGTTFNNFWFDVKFQNAGKSHILSYANRNSQENITDFNYTSLT